MKLLLISYLFGNTNLDDKITKWLRIRANEITILPQQQPSGPALTEPLEWMFSMIFPPVLTPLPGQPVMRVIIPGLQTGSAALKHLQFVSNFSFEANHCAEQNLSRHNDSERLVAIMLKILNFKKKGKESKFLLLEQQGPASSLPLTSHLHLLNKPGKEVDSVPERYWEEECERKSAFLFLNCNCSKSKCLRKSEVSAQHHWRAPTTEGGRKGYEPRDADSHLQKPQPESTVDRHISPANPGKLPRTHICEGSLLVRASLIIVSLSTRFLGPQGHKVSLAFR